MLYSVELLLKYVIKPRGRISEMLRQERLALLLSRVDRILHVSLKSLNTQTYLLHCSMDPAHGYISLIALRLDLCNLVDCLLLGSLYLRPKMRSYYTMGGVDFLRECILKPGNCLSKTLRQE